MGKELALCVLYCTEVIIYRFSARGGLHNTTDLSQIFNSFPMWKPAKDLTFFPAFLPSPALLPAHIARTQC